MDGEVHFSEKSNTTYWPKRKAHKMTKSVLAWEVASSGVYAELSPLILLGLSVSLKLLTTPSVRQLCGLFGPFSRPAIMWTLFYIEFLRKFEKKELNCGAITRF